MTHQRVNHKIVDNKGTKAPQFVVFFDTETKDKHITPTKKELTLKLGYAILTRRFEGKGYVTQSECIFYNRATFFKWIDKVCVGKSKYTFVAHNIGFDVRITGIMRYLSTHEWERTSFILDGLNFMARYRKGKTSIFLMNNMQLFNVSLRELGNSVGMEKLEVDFGNVSDTDLLTYCKRDVEVMRIAWNKWQMFVEVNDLGNFKCTIGSQAFSAFRHRFKTKDIYIHTNEKAIELERESYHGGRVECFFIGKYREGKVYALDINSMYPYVMKVNKVPNKLTAYYDHITISDFNRISKSCGYIVQATITLKEPLLPVVHEGKLLFPVGKISGVFCKPELELARQRGILHSVSRLCVYNEEIAFASFVEFFYSQRLKYKASGNVQYTYFTKLLMNSLYGKFGQKVTEYKQVGFNSKLPDSGGSTYSLFKGRNVKYRIIDGIIEEESGEHESNDTFVAIASYITSHARVYLASLIKQCGWRNIIYCDTDSLFVNEKGYKRLVNKINPDTIGKLKVEGCSNNVIIHAPKRYKFGDKNRNKGIRSNATQIGVNTYFQEQFESFTGGLASGHTDSVIITDVIKHLTAEYNKGTVLPNGRVVPLVFS